MNEIQKKIRLKNLEKARKAKPPPKHISIHPTIRDLSEEHPLHFKKVQLWIKDNEEELQSLRKEIRLKYNKESNNKLNILDVYVWNMKNYLRSGTWLDSRYGQDREFKITWSKT